MPTFVGLTPALHKPRYLFAKQTEVRKLPADIVSKARAISFRVSEDPPSATFQTGGFAMSTA